MTVSGPLGHDLGAPTPLGSLAQSKPVAQSEPVAQSVAPTEVVLAESVALPRVPSGRFGQRDRILLQREFKAVLQHGWRGRGSHLQVVARRRSADVGVDARLGISVSKQLGNSPARARMRRLIREAFRTLRASALGGVDVVVLARIPWPLANLAEVSAEMSKIFDYVCSNLDRERRTRSPSDRRPQRSPTP